jgi:hypothetical protein
MTIANTSLFLVQFPAGTKVCQVDDFPAGTPRSRKGSIHVKPGTQKLTRQELDHLTSLGIKSRMLRKMAPKPPKGEGTPAPKPAAASKPRRGRGGDKSKPEDAG